MICYQNEAGKHSQKYKICMKYSLLKEVCFLGGKGCFAFNANSGLCETGNTCKNEMKWVLHKKSLDVK